MCVQYMDIIAIGNSNTVPLHGEDKNNKQNGRSTRDRHLVESIKKTNKTGRVQETDIS